MSTKANDKATRQAALRAAAFDLIPSLRIGDKLEITQDGRTNIFTVYSDTFRSDVQFGSWESTRVGVWIRPGGYGLTLTAEMIADGKVTIRKVTEGVAS